MARNAPSQICQRPEPGAGRNTQPRGSRPTPSLPDRLLQTLDTLALLAHRHRACQRRTYHHRRRLPVRLHWRSASCRAGRFAPRRRPCLGFTPRGGGPRTAAKSQAHSPPRPCTSFIPPTCASGSPAMAGCPDGLSSSRAASLPLRCRPATLVPPSAPTPQRARSGRDHFPVLAAGAVSAAARVLQHDLVQPEATGRGPCRIHERRQSGRNPPDPTARPRWAGAEKYVLDSCGGRFELRSQLIRW
jgi:hypothetical protein